MSIRVKELERIKKLPDFDFTENWYRDVMFAVEQDGWESTTGYEDVPIHYIFVLTIINEELKQIKKEKFVLRKIGIEHEESEFYFVVLEDGVEKYKCTMNQLKPIYEKWWSGVLNSQ